MKQQKVYLFNWYCIGVSNCDNEKEAREVIKNQKPYLFNFITKPLGVNFIRFGWFSGYDHNGSLKS